MNTIVWKDEHSVGSKTLDQQHQVIAQLINSLIKHYDEKVDSAIISEVLNEMLNYIQQHLIYEEKILKENNYPDLIEHTASHTGFIDQFTQFSYRVMAHDNKVPKELLLFLNNWWEEHILIEDQKYHSFLLGKGIH